MTLEGQVFRFLFLAFLPFVFFALLVWSYLDDNRPKWRALAESLFPPLVFTRKLEYFSLGFGPRIGRTEQVKVFFRLCFTLGLLMLGLRTAVSVVKPALPSVPWVLAGLAAGLAINAFLSLLLNPAEMALYRRGSHTVKTHEWRFKATGAHHRPATVEEVYESKHGDGSWKARQNSVENVLLLLRALIWFGAALTPPALLVSRRMSQEAGSVLLALIMLFGLPVSILAAKRRG